jgi:hypothetical protein
MKKTTKKNPKASHKKAKDLDVKPARGGSVSGGQKCAIGEHFAKAKLVVR